VGGFQSFAATRANVQVAPIAVVDAALAASGRVGSTSTPLICGDHLGNFLPVIAVRRQRHESRERDVEWITHQVGSGLKKAPRAAAGSSR
jgi:hypothetical protein